MLRKRPVLLLVANVIFALAALFPVIGFVADSTYRGQFSPLDALLYVPLCALGLFFVLLVIRQWLAIYRSLAFRGG